MQFWKFIRSSMGTSKSGFGGGTIGIAAEAVAGPADGSGGRLDDDVHAVVATEAPDGGPG
jgi:hypothetical protein